jgi:ubiquinone/menaquinone biosynthesis C-methylase UbiE
MPSSPDRSPQLSHEEFWRRYDAVEARLTAPVSERMLDLAALVPGMRVLDVATGRGEPALRAARRVGPSGWVLGVDPSAAILQMARERARREDVTNIELRPASAEQLHDLPREYFHAATVRWGLMVMADPVTALVNTRRALMPGGALVAALWAEPQRVPYYSLPRRLLRRYRPLPRLDPQAPGTFRYAELVWIERDFERAGYQVEQVEEMEIPVFEAETVAELIAWERGLGLAQLLDELPAARQRAWEMDFEAELEQTRTDGVLRLGGVTRIVLARPAVASPSS